MSKKMLIDAAHSEETRVAIVDTNTLVEFDTENIHKKNLKSNIYLARVVRVEPSLQAAFVEYGGNRQGFLAFNDIHPDYYQIPVEDREKLMAEVEAENKPEDDADAKKGDAEDEKKEASEGDTEEVSNNHGDDPEDFEAKRASIAKRYRIQEVIKPRQVLLVQIIREARGMKGAALTTYISLPGRYCVLMPNAGGGAGGVSRKITDVTTRRKLKTVVESLNIPDGMGLIIRTAGLGRTKTEIKRDYEYLTRMWSNIRELTLKSTAPALVYEEGDLIKRAIRDLYTRDVEEVFVEGDAGYKEAKAFMKLIMPSHSKKIQAYKDEKAPLFHAHQVEDQLQATYEPTVSLKSGGSIVITPTEALVSIDVNSGKSTRERGIEDTAYKTNLEAAEEIARQLKLRDHGGLIVIDFIDMYENRHRANVEKKLREAVKTDRARIQIGRISSFGLLEMSRQRLRPSINETGSERCSHCNGLGVIRSTDAIALRLLRQIESEGIKGGAEILRVKVPVDVAVHLLNTKRAQLSNLEEKYGFKLQMMAETNLKNHEAMIERVNPQEQQDKRKKGQNKNADENQQGREEKRDNKRSRNRRKNKGNRDDAAMTTAQTDEQQKPEAVDNTVKDIKENKEAKEIKAEEGSESTPKEAPKKRRRTQPSKKVDEKAEDVKENKGEEPKGDTADKAEEQPQKRARNTRGNTRDDQGDKRRRPSGKREDKKPREPKIKIAKDLKPVVKRAKTAAPTASSTNLDAVTIANGAEKPKKGWWSK